MGQDSSLLSSVIVGVVFVATTVVAVLTVDKFGRKVLLQPALNSFCIMLLRSGLVSAVVDYPCSLRHQQRFWHGLLMCGIRTGAVPNSVP